MVMIVEQPGVDVALAQRVLDGGQVHICDGLFYTTDGIAGFPGRREKARAPSCRRPIERLIPERVESPNLELPKIPFISGRNNQTVYPRGRGDHSVLQQLWGLLIHKCGPIPESTPHP